jgi:gliding motility-associated-like protein
MKNITMNFKGIRKIFLPVFLFLSLIVCRAQTPPHYWYNPVNSGVNNLFFNSGVCNKFQFIYTKNEIASMTAPVTGPILIDTIWFRHGGGSSSTNTVLSNLTVKLAHTTLVNPSANFAANFTSAPVIVLSSSNYTYTPNIGNWNVPSNNWTPIPLQTPFNYNFTDNLLVEFEFSNSSGFIVGNYADNGGIPITQYSATPGSTSADGATARPMFGISQGCNLPDINLGPDLNACQGNSFTLSTNFNNGENYLWSNGSIDTGIVVSSSGNYWINVTNSCGTSGDTVNVNIFPNPGINAGNDIFATIGQSIQLQANSSGPGNFQWLNGQNFSCTQCNNPQFTASTDTFFVLVFTDANGCTASDTVFVYVDEPCDLTFPNFFSPNNDGINDSISFSKPCIQDLEWIIYDRWGKKVFETRNKNSVWDGSSNGKKVSDGTYFYIIDITLTDKKEIKKNGFIFISK